MKKLVHPGAVGQPSVQGKGAKGDGAILDGEDVGWYRVFVEYRLILILLYSG